MYDHLSEVLWDYEDCNDQTEDVIAMKLKTRRFKMSTFRRGDARRTLFPHDSSISSTRIRVLLCSLSICGPKSDIKKVFHAGYQQAILDLEAEQNILRLCSAQRRGVPF